MVTSNPTTRPTAAPPPTPAGLDAARPVGLAWWRLVPLAAPVVVGLVATGLAWWSLMPGVGFWDTAEFQTVGPVMGTAHPTGYATYVLLGWLASVLFQPLGDPAFRMNLLSAVCLGVAAAFTVDLVRLLTRSTALGVAAGLGLAMTPIVWGIATHADPHALHLAFVAILLWLLVRWEDAVAAGRATAVAGARASDRWLVAAALAFGLSAANHSLTLLLALPVGLFVVAVEPEILRRPRLIAGCLLVLLCSFFLVNLELVLRGGPFRAPLVYGTPGTWDGFWYVLLAEQFHGWLNDPFGDLPRKAAQLAGIAGDQLGPLSLLVPLGAGAAVIRRPRYALLTITAMVLTLGFNAAYTNADISRYYLGPALIAWTWLAILAAVVVDAIAGALGVRYDDPDGRAVRPALAAATAAAAAVVLLAPSLLVLPARHRAVDRSHDVGSRPWLRAVLAELEPNAVVVSWWSYSTALWYAQRVEGQRPDLTIIDDRTRLDEHLGAVSDVIEANIDERPVYVIRLEPDELAGLRDRYYLAPLGSPSAISVLKVNGRIAGATP
jgi:hypothetical protein